MRNPSEIALHGDGGKRDKAKSVAQIKERGESVVRKSGRLGAGLVEF